jgi:lysozyme
LWRRIRIVTGVLLSLAMVCLFAWLFAINWRPGATAFPVQGVDVAEAQGAIDWWKVKEQGVQFAYIHATSGAHGRDRHFAANWRGVYETATPHGAIHRFSLCQLAADQAGNFVAAVPRAPDLLPFALELDFEPDCAARPARDVVLGEINLFLATVEPHMGKRAILKITRRFDNWYRVSDAIHRPLWSIEPFFPPSYFDKPWTIWQASSFRRVDGVANAVNWDVMAR